MTSLVQRIGRRVRGLREAQGWSQETLAERAGLNRSYIGEVERGSVIASVVTVEKIAHALALSLPALLDIAPASDEAALTVHASLPLAEVPDPLSAKRG
jgi:transcriptional regulator with XRE-family HTH domain